MNERGYKSLGEIAIEADRRRTRMEEDPKLREAWRIEQLTRANERLKYVLELQRGGGTIIYDPVLGWV